MKRPSEVVWQEFRNRVAELGGRVVETEWLGINTPHRIVCKAGHAASPTPSTLARRGGLCRACAGKDPDTAWRAFHLRVTQLGGQVVEPKWLGCQTPHRVICKEGHTTNPRPNDVQQGRGICRTCAGNDSSATEKAFLARVAELGGQVVEPRWLGTKQPHRVICAQRHEGRPRPSDVLKGHGLCLTCAGKDPAVTERAFRSAIAEWGGQVIEPAWLGIRKPHRVICPIGHQIAAHPSTILRGGNPCSICAGRAPGLAFQAFRERVEELGGRVLEAEWLGSAVGHRVTCREGHECTPRPACIGQGQGLCRTCAGNDSAAAWRIFRDRVVELGGRVAEKEWLGNDVPHRVVCRKGHETAVRPGSVRNGQGICRFCAGKTWDIFYVVANESQGRVKFGITSTDVRRRLQAHRRNGYRDTIRTIAGLTDAAELETWVQSTLRLAGIKPVQGREYYDVAALAVILDIVDNWPRLPPPR